MSNCPIQKSNMCTSVTMKGYITVNIFTSEIFNTIDIFRTEIEAILPLLLDSLDEFEIISLIVHVCYMYMLIMSMFK